MDTVSFFGLQHGRVHSSSVSSVSSIADQVFGGLTDQQMRAKGLNSLVWLLWHKARVEGAYRDAVGLRTRDVVATLAPASWAEPVNAVDAARVPRPSQFAAWPPASFAKRRHA